MISRASFRPKLFYDNYELCSLSEDLKELLSKVDVKEARVVQCLKIYLISPDIL